MVCKPSNQSSPIRGRSPTFSSTTSSLSKQQPACKDRDSSCDSLCDESLYGEGKDLDLGRRANDIAHHVNQLSPGTFAATAAATAAEEAAETAAEEATAEKTGRRKQSDEDVWHEAEIKFEERFNLQINEVIDLTGDIDGGYGRKKRGTKKDIRNPPIDESRLLSSATVRVRPSSLGGKEAVPTMIKVKPGDFIEIPARDATHFRAEFLEIQKLYRSGDNINGPVIARGLLYARTKYLLGMLPRKMNEICQILRIDVDDDRPAAEQAAVEVTLYSIIARRIFRFTNADWPRNRAFRGPHDDATFLGVGELRCRWRFTLTFASATEREKNRPKFNALEHMTEDEPRVKSAMRVLDINRYHFWREPKRWPGSSVNPVEVVEDESSSDSNGSDDETSNSSVTESTSVSDIADSGKRKRTSETSITGPHQKKACLISRSGRVTLQAQADFLAATELEATASTLRDANWRKPLPNVPKNKREGRSKYTIADTFCGAGGASRGAKLAGLDVVLGIDHWKLAMETWRLSFPDAFAYEMDVAKYIEDFDELVKEGGPSRVDIMHLSPPCQVWSPAHTISGRNDKKNTEALYTCAHLVELLRPRVFTLEQTFGILHEHHRPFFNAMLNGFTSNGYSLRWGVHDLRQWGVPVSRKRLIVMASCPGQKLPNFPAATHASPEAIRHQRELGANLREWNTPRKALSNLRSTDQLNSEQDVIERARAPDRYETPWCANVPLSRCITTTGGHNYHWNGTRDFTAREYASLQTFPRTHRFVGVFTAVRRQVGNAYPPAAARAFFSAVREAFEKEDGPCASEVPGMEIINLDSDGGMTTGDGDSGPINPNEPILISDNEDEDSCEPSSDDEIDPNNGDPGEDDDGLNTMEGLGNFDNPVVID